MEHLSSNITNISANGNPPKKFLTFQETETLKSLSYFGKCNLSVLSEKIFYISGKGNPKKIPYIFSKGNCSYISGNLVKVLYISGNETFLYFEKGIFRTLAYLEVEEYLEHCQTSGITFCKNSYLAHFLIFQEMKLSSPSELEK